MDAPRSKKMAAASLAVPPVLDEPKQAATGKTTTRADLLDAVYTACPLLSRAQARQIFEETLEEIVTALLRGEPVKLRSFGAFNVRAKRERIGRNPRNGVEAVINARRVLTFKASPTLVARINGWIAPSEDDD